MGAMRELLGEMHGLQLYGQDIRVYFHCYGNHPVLDSIHLQRESGVLQEPHSLRLSSGGELFPCAILFRELQYQRRPDDHWIGLPLSHTVASIPMHYDQYARIWISC